jgi:ABC-type transporter lipoprotein component MlaA/pimeloyl-ACP methyl ester carboxylesterase
MSSSTPSPALRQLTPGFRRLGSALVAGSLFTACSTAPDATTSHPQGSHIPQTAGRETPKNFPEIMGDPLEPVNRGVWKFNEGLLLGVIRPTARVYRGIVPRPARKSVSNFTRNILTPGRLINETLQGRWRSAGDETLRFLTNTTVGVGGLFDVASRWDIPKPNADFAQTFHKWGARPHAFVMLPGLGPNDDLHTAGAVADRVPQVWNFFDFFSYATVGLAFNNISNSTEQAATFIEAEADPYVGTKYIWTYASSEEKPDWSTGPDRDRPTLQTLNVVTVGPEDPEFVWHGRESSVRIPATGRKLKYNLWLQKEAAPVVYVVPGLSSHRVSGQTLSVAELLFENGYSVVTVSGVFHAEFMENASTVALPAYPPADCHDLLVAMTEIDRKLDRKNPGKIRSRALLGYSMGGFQALYLAAQGTGDSGLLDFDRYVAINTPVDLEDGIRKLDSFQDAPLDWPAPVRQQKINNTLLKAANFLTLTPEQLANPPFDATESRMIVGLSFRLTLRDTIYSSQSRENMGILKTPLNDWRRDPAYDEILNYSYSDYYKSFVLPYYAKRGITSSDFTREDNLRTYQSALAANPKVRVLANQDDFITDSSDISWLRSTIGSSRFTVFPNGGHLGNLGTPPVQQGILKSLEGL